MKKGLYLLVAGALVLAAASAVQAAISGQLTVYGSDGSAVDVTMKYSGSAPDVLTSLKASYNGGAWNVGQFKNTTSDASHGFGWADNGVDQVKVAYTFYGDATLDGSVDSNDLTKVLANYNQLTNMVWSQGDFDYNATVDSNDLAKVLANYNQGPMLPGITALDQTNAIPGEFYWVNAGVTGGLPPTYLLEPSRRVSGIIGVRQVNDIWRLGFVSASEQVSLPSPPEGAVVYIEEPGKVYDVSMYLAKEWRDYGYTAVFQSDFAVPEPCSLIVWSLLGTVAIGVGWWRRRKSA